MLKMKESEKTSEKQLNETELSNLPDKDFKVMREEWTNSARTSRKR